MTTKTTLEAELDDEHIDWLMAGDNNGAAVILRADDWEAVRTVIRQQGCEHLLASLQFVPMQLDL